MALTSQGGGAPVEVDETYWGNKKRKGDRSYYPLFATVAQTGQVLDFFHRSGNVHDSIGARVFILACIRALREVASAQNESAPTIAPPPLPARSGSKRRAACSAHSASVTIPVTFDAAEKLPILSGRSTWAMSSASISIGSAARCCRSSPRWRLRACTPPRPRP